MVTYQADGLTALGDPTRRAIFESLAERPQAVGELADDLPVSRPAVSQHLKVLKDAGLVIGRAAGNRRIYHVDPDGVGALRAYLEHPVLGTRLRECASAILATQGATADQIFGSLDAMKVRALRAYLDRFWNQSLAAYKAAVERQDEEVS